MLLINYLLLIRTFLRERMNNSVQLEVTFNENRERESQKFFFQYAWRKHFLRLKIVSVCAVLFLLISFLPINQFKESIISYLFKFFGFLCIGYVCLVGIRYFASKRQTDHLIEKRINDLKQLQEKTSFVILNEESITIKKPTNMVGSHWNKTSYKMIGKYIILNLLQNKINLIFTASGFEGSDYNTFKDFVQKYSQQQA